MKIVFPHILATASVGALLFTTACSASDSTSDPATSSEANGNGETLNIVASTSIWADVAEAVAETSNADIEVTAVVEGNDVDPHSFEPTAADLARANDADIVVAGGGGYDAWLYESVEDQDKIVAPLELISHDHAHGHDHGEEGHSHGHDEDHSHDHEDHGHSEDHAHDAEDHAHDHDHGHDEEHGHDGDHAHDGDHGHGHGTVEMIDGNEHIWYDTNAVTLVAEEVAEHINSLDSEADASADSVVERMDEAHHRIHELPELNYAQTESIADYLLSHAPMTDKTPGSYRKAILNHSEPAAADLARFLEEIDAGDIDVLIYNPQTSTDMTDRIRTAAENADVTIVEIGETPPADTNFLDYFDQVLDELEQLGA